MEEVFVKLHTKDNGVENELEFSMSNVTELQKVMIIHNMFEKMGVQNDLSKMVEDYTKIGQAFNSFYNKVDNEESKPTADIQQQVHDGKSYEQKTYSKTILAKQYDKALKDSTGDPEEEAPQESSNLASSSIPSSSYDRPEHHVTGILKEEGRPTKYQCRYHCTCGNQKTLYIPKDAKKVKCNNCRKEYPVRWAKSGFLEKDRWNNFFIAGKFIGEEDM